MTGFDNRESLLLSDLHLSVTADIVAQLNPRADVEKCAVFTQKKARPALDQRADTDGDHGGHGGHGGHAEAEGYGVGAASKGAAAPLGLVMALLALVFLRL